MQDGYEPRRQSSVFVVKLGGSIITYKDKAFTPRLSALERIASELASIYEESSLGIVLGGGSYGHYAALQQRENETNAANALYMVSSLMLELSQLVVDVLALHGIPALIYPPHALCSPKGLRPNCYWEQARNAISIGAVPVTYGDIYPCSSDKGWCIVSGDELAMEMACSLGARKVVYASDVDGILDDRGNVVKEISLSELYGSRILASESSHVDVTGGLRRKLDSIRENWCSGLQEVWIVNGLREGRIIGAIKGLGYGTLIKP